MSSSAMVTSMHPSCSVPTLQLGQIISALTYALDLTEGHPQGHALRTCILGMRLGRRIGLSEEELSDLFYGLLLKDVGSSNNTSRMFEILGYDFVEVRGLLQQSWTGGNWKQIGRVIRRLNEIRSVPSRARGMLQALKRSRTARRELARQRCEMSADIARDLGLSWRAAEAIYHIDERWDGKGFPDGQRGEAIPLLSRVIKIAQTLDATRESYGEDGALQFVRHHSKRWFDPALVAATEAPGLWEDLEHHHLLSYVVAMEPNPLVLEANSFTVDHICAAFARVIDARSHYTLTHSRGVAEIANFIAQKLGVGEAELQTLRRAALLHDVGKLGVPASVLEKPGKLDAAEWEAMKLHARHTYEIVQRIPGFEQIACIAASHHERLDGSGYCTGRSGGELCLLSRILAVADVYDALAHDRSYRRKRSSEEIAQILREQTPHALDAACVNALLEEGVGNVPALRCA